MSRRRRAPVARETSDVQRGRGWLLVSALVFAAVLAGLAGLLFGTFATLGFLAQRFGQPLDLLFNVRLRRLQFLSPRFNSRLFGAGSLLLRLLVLSRFLQLLFQSAQLGFQFAPLLTNFAGLLFRSFAAFGFLAQRFGQSLDLLFNLRLRSL